MKKINTGIVIGATRRENLYVIGKEKLAAFIQDLSLTLPDIFIKQLKMLLKNFKRQDQMNWPVFHKNYFSSGL